MKIKIKEVLQEINSGKETIKSKAIKLQISSTLLRIRLIEYCKKNNETMRKQKAGRKRTIIFE